jgi:hypothetical protein
VPAAAPIRVTAAAARSENDALFAARAALKLAAKQLRDAQAQRDHLRALVDQLESAAARARPSTDAA